jgi:hypothetical protein
MRSKKLYFRSEMSERKVVSRNVAIALGIICMVLVACLVGAIANYTSIVSEKDSVIKAKDAQIAALQTQMNLLNNSLSWYQSEYRSYKYAYESLKQDYDKLKANYDELQSIIEGGKAVAESATWFSEDKRLKVTSEVIPYAPYGTLWHYTVKVTVTNVGEKPLSKVWIIIFVYKGDKLIEGWDPFWYSKSVENLYIGESYSYNFTYLPKDMTSYKVIAVAG